MPLEVPKTDKVYTTTYENFKGVDFTNDATNTFKRRTPTGFNMMPNLDGKPYKRRGWKIEYTPADFARLYSEATSETYEGDVEVNKLEYFEIAGLDHVAIFTDIALFMLRATNNGEELILISTDEDVKASYERTFFFEGDGTAAFYVYGNYKIWSYKWDDETDGFVFSLETPYVPAIRISTTADGNSAVAHEGVNMVGDKVAEEFQNNIVPYVESETMVGATKVDSKTFLSFYSEAKQHVFTYADSRWKDEAGVFVEMTNIGVTPASGATTVKITVKNELVVYLFNMISSDVGVTVKVTDGKYSNERFGRTLTAVTGTPSEGEFTVSTKIIQTEGGNIEKSVIVFHDAYLPLVEGEDAVRVEYPITRFTKSSHSLGDTTVVWR